LTFNRLHGVTSLQQLQICPSFTNAYKCYPSSFLCMFFSRTPHSRTQNVPCLIHSSNCGREHYMDATNSGRMIRDRFLARTLFSSPPRPPLWRLFSFPADAYSGVCSSGGKPGLGGAAPRSRPRTGPTVQHSCRMQSLRRREAMLPLPYMSS
jgi:hypothetical protein